MARPAAASTTAGESGRRSSVSSEIAHPGSLATERCHESLGGQFLDGGDELMTEALGGLREHGILEENERHPREPEGLSASIRGGIEDSKVVCRWRICHRPI